MIKTCIEVMEQLAYKQDLNIVEKLGLKMHLFICKKCKKVDLQFSVMDKNLSLLVRTEMKKHEEEVLKIKQKVKDRFSA